MTSFDYDLTAQLNDGSEVKLNPEVHGWAEPERLAKVVVWSLIPRIEALPVVVVQIPEGAKPVFMSRVYGKGLPGTGGPSFRAYCIGWFKDGETYRTWVMPGNVIEVGEDPLYADMMLKKLVTERL
jgi:hypothetical protein